MLLTFFDGVSLEGTKSLILSEFWNKYKNKQANYSPGAEWECFPFLFKHSLFGFIFFVVYFVFGLFEISNKCIPTARKRTTAKGS